MRFPSTTSEAGFVLAAEEAVTDPPLAAKAQLVILLESMRYASPDTTLTSAEGKEFGLYELPDTPETIVDSS